jgi:hypothetical protein
MAGVWEGLADPLTAVVVAVILVVLASVSESCLLKLVLLAAAVAALVWMGLSHAATGRPVEWRWESVLSFLERPIVALVLALVLAFIGTRSGWRLAKLLAFCGAAAAFLWAAIRYQAVGGIVSATVSTAGTVLIWLIAAIVVVTLALVAAVVVMFLASPPRRPPRRPRPARDGPPPERAGRFTGLADELAELLEDDHVLDGPGSLLRFYFSGLRDVRDEIADIHRRCDREIVDLAEAAPAEFPELEPGPLRRLARRRTALPDRDEWAELMDELEVPVPYAAMRVLLVRRDWREVATIFYKCYVCARLLGGAP